MPTRCRRRSSWWMSCRRPRPGRSRRTSSASGTPPSTRAERHPRSAAAPAPGGRPPARGPGRGPHAEEAFCSASCSRTLSMSKLRTPAISCSSADAGRAPAWLKTRIPWRKAMSVGIDRMFAAADRPCSASVSTLAKTTSGCASLAASKTGAKRLHGPHQSAQKSTSTMSLAVTVSSKVPAVSAVLLMEGATTSRREDSRSAEGAEQIAASLLAAAADLGADPAVLVHVGVPLALVAARLARGGARLEDHAGDVRVVTGVPRQHPSGRLAHVGAVEARADALPEIGDHLLAEIGVGARGAGLRALHAGLDAGDQLLPVDPAEVGR